MSHNSGKPQPMTSNLMSAIELQQRLNKSLVSSSQSLGWSGVLVQQYQHPSSAAVCEMDVPALSEHWLNLLIGHPAHLTQKRDGRLHESLVHRGHSIFTPAGQPSYWRGEASDTDETMLHIHLNPALVRQVAQAAEIDSIDLVNCFSKPDLRLYQIAMLLLSELNSDGIMGRLYVESLTQVLVIHLLRNYSSSVPQIALQHSGLTTTQLRQTIDYIQAHLDQNLSLAEIAATINISPTYFSNLFKRATGNSPHQYVIQQRVERAKELLKTTDLAIASIAFQVGFSSQSHLTQHFKRLTGSTPKQASKIVRI
jgi:AraC family transcriptional regulator